MTETALGRRRLGRGLEALLGPTREEAEREGSLVALPVREIRPNPFQPRQDVHAASLEELKSSIQQAGPLPPEVVRTAAGGGSDLIVGERRLGGRHARAGGGCAGALGSRDRRPRARGARTGAAPAPQARSGTGARGAAHRRGAAPPAGHRRTGDAAREGEGADPRRVLLERGPRAPARGLPRSSVRRMKDRAVTIVIHTDGDLDSRQYRVPVWAFEAGEWGGRAGAPPGGLVFALAGAIRRAAGRVPRLVRRGRRASEAESPQE